MKNNNENIQLDHLPCDILIKIFSLCGIQSWSALSQVCHRFNTILGPHSYLWDQISRHLLLVNEISPVFQCRGFGLLSAREKCRIYRNWRKGTCKFLHVTAISERHIIPWIQLDSDILWVSKGNCINAYTRFPPSIFHGQSRQKKSHWDPPLLSLFSYGGDVGRFTAKDGVVVTGNVNGSLLVWRSQTGKLQFQKSACHSSEVSTVNLTKNLIVSGSRDKTVKIWHYNWRNLSFAKQINVKDRVLSLDIDPSGKLLCTGTAGHCEVPPSQLYDLSSGKLITPLRKQFREGEGVYDIHFESTNELLTADFNSALRLWDVRTQSQVAVWEDPHDSAINCIASDNNFTILTGTATQGGIRLWDKRQNKCVQFYFACSEARSPVYGLDFDSSELFVALDSSVACFDFSSTGLQKSCQLAVFECT